ncbi:helix-turn-helix domain-containing protein [Vibrio ponticus]|uniref:Helix-turn-helix domain-containing protein n=1 Tax=Vibrio ponticus TaxID=265668 RepID=A0A3N3E512_9VIBR|nr:helix-turn-helix domain-containing protein [Vibrio ponticus]
MKRTFWVTLLLFVTQIVYAFDSSPSVFYPLPSESQGKVFAAKQLFLSSNGGLWIHDVRDKVLFFDGQSVAPKTGSALPYRTKKVIIYDDLFWSYENNIVYRSTSHSQREIVFELPPGTEIESMGANDGYIWLTDDAHFHTYRIADGEYSSYSLMELYRYGESLKLSINDALLVKQRWVIATGNGVFVSESQGFRHVPRSQGNGIDKLYYSSSRRELILGSSRGAVVYDINNTSKPKFIIPAPNVTVIAETPQSYWIGTQNGLYIYSFIGGKMEKHSGEKDAGFALTGRRILSLVNDNSGGMWISTNKGIQYFSLFGEKFERFPSQDMGVNKSHTPLSNMVTMQDKQGYWVMKSSGLYRFFTDKGKRKERIYSGRVYNVLEHDGKVWLATNQGVIVLDAKTGERITNTALSAQFDGQKITHIAIDSKGLIWIANSQSVWCYDPNKQGVKLIAEQWQSNSSLGSKLTQMLVSSGDDLVLGTERGVYLLQEGQLKYIAQSAQFGAIHGMTEGSEQQIWLASNYGVNILDINMLSVLPVPLVDEHISPQCLMKNRTGAWLTSTAGLTHYTLDGKLVAHYGQPFGVINNEFRNSFCLLDANDSDSLLLGSWHSLIRVQSKDLTVTPLPDTNVLFSQILVNQQLVAFGADNESKIIAPYGDSISIQMGTMPRISGSSLEYRLNNEKIWTPLDGYQIAMEGLTPGEYTLYVRPVVNGLGRGGVRSLKFEVSEPWYLNSFALVLYVVSGLSLLVGAVYWRSRMMASANRRLKAQVALKTNQLRHQSRILLSNNHQLRKQLQVRRLIFGQAIQSFKDRLRAADGNITSDGVKTQSHMVEQISSELELLLNVRESHGQNSPAYNLSMILKSTLGGWREEFTKAGIEIELDMSTAQNAYVVLNYFNLDVLLNLVFDGLVKRCSRHQNVYIKLECSESEVQLTFMDDGILADFNQDEHWLEVVKLVNVSGGQLEVDENSRNNKMSLSWLRSHTFDENSIVNVEELAGETAAFTSSDPFIVRLEQLVMEHYADPEFSTSTAAKMLFVSERSLQRRFKGATQRRFSEYLSEVRLDNACRLLLAGAKVADVAFDCGFNDPSYFSQRFKHRFGVSPTQFVEQSDTHEETF